jgi:molybdopterin-biosynthesis enzyme MoeA-like protein
MSNHVSRTASYVLIGDEILSGTVQDTNGPFLANYFRKRGIDLLRIEIIPDKVQHCLSSKAKNRPFC